MRTTGKITIGEMVILGFAALGVAGVIAVPRVLAGTLTCSITTTCNSPSVVVLRMASTTNSHAELPTGSTYPYLVCCSGVTGLGNSCAASIKAVVANLYATTNSHVEQGTLSNYTNQACLSVSAGSVSVGYTTTSSCSGWDTTLFSMASSTNSHVAQPGTSTFQPGATMQACATAVAGGGVPSITGVTVNGGGAIILSPNTTKSVNVTANISDPNGCSALTAGTTTVLLYRSGVGSSTCQASANNLNCYQATAFTATSTCSSNAMNVTTTFNVYYFAQATDSSSSFASQNWLATLIFRDSTGATSSADAATGQELNTLLAINVTTSSINYGTVTASTTTGGVNQTTTVQDVGNSSTTLKVSGTALVSAGHPNLATSSQHFATTTFNYGIGDTTLLDVGTAVPGFLLVGPTSTGTVQKNVYWGIGVPAGFPTGTYNGTTTFTAVFSS